MLDDETDRTSPVLELKTNGQQPIAYREILSY